jgi:hypothetical protein
MAKLSYVTDCIRHTQNTRKALEEDVEREQGFASTIARLRAQLTRTKEEAADHEAASDAGAHVPNLLLHST